MDSWQRQTDVALIASLDCSFSAFRTAPQRHSPSRP